VAELASPAHNNGQAFGQAVAAGDFNSEGKPDIAEVAPPGDTETTITNPSNTGGVYLYCLVNKKAGFFPVLPMFS